MINLLFLILAVPALSFAQDAAVSYKLSPLGLSFMALAWVSIIIWNILCFQIILKNK